MTDRAANIIAEAIRPYLLGDDPPASETVRQQFADSVADVALAALKTARIAVMELPEPDIDTNAWDAGCGAITHVHNRDVRLHSVAYEEGVMGGIYRSPAKAREMAVALLATADAAEASQ
ncbi:hypothetical protein [Mycobacterium sp. CnD-18-1]|uniref:hypothetical protein n=1 Tax=Mycobacterium sp. CnD-18-1 TaxID=2917744 RepID=UPI001EF2F9C3|nr:hypothetical protein [Mycobacterium sp. CnD-18-1]MCG7607058.1 hypothetical protein [Mycobacterium sp. CnD-18-1]